MKELFIISAQRSGSNWLHRCLARHPAIRINGELNPSLMLATLDQIRTGDEVSTEKLMEDGTLRKLARNYVRQAMAANTDLKEEVEGLSYIADKSAFSCVLSLANHPRQLEYASLLSEYFPDAKKILLIRDVRDVIVSYSEWKGQPLGSLLKLSPYAYYRFIRHVRNWCLLHERWLRDADSDSNFLVINYSELKAHFKDVLKEVYEFLGIGVKNEFINALERDLYSISSNVFATENRERGYSFFRSGKVGEWRAEFKWYHRIVTQLVYRARIRKICVSHDGIRNGTEL